MKLRNKKTGEIVDTLCSDDITKGISFGIDHHDGNPTMAYYCSLAELNEDWEDYEEPKEYWFINDLDGKPMKCELRYCPVRDFDEWSEKRKKIGNYFSSREEAEKAAEKLKAWKRLNNCGLKFIDWWLSKDNHIIIGTNRQIFDIDEQGLREDLNLLFGGEE